MHGVLPQRVRVTKAPADLFPLADSAGSSQDGMGEGSKGPNPDWALTLMSSYSMIIRGVLKNVVNAIGQLGADLQGIDAWLAEQRLHLAREWHQLEASIKLHRQNEVARVRGEKSAAKAKEANERAF